MEMYIFYKYLAEAYLKIDDKKNTLKYYLEYLEVFPYDSKILKNAGHIPFFEANETFQNEILDFIDNRCIKD